MELKDAINTLSKAIDENNIDPTVGLGNDLFLFASSLVPLVNVDLLIVDESKGILLAWRDDKYCGTGWHIPGGCLRLRETLADAIQNTSLREIGSKVTFDSTPIAVEELIAPKHRHGISNHRQRAHNVALLFKCTLPNGYEPDNRGLKETDVGYVKWFASLPDNLIWLQEKYKPHIDKLLYKEQR